MAAATERDLQRAAAELIIRTQVGSAALLQRRFGIGFSHATELLDLFESVGVVGPTKGEGRVRDVLVLPHQLGEVLASHFPHEEPGHAP